MWVTRTNIWDVSATPLEIKREWYCVFHDYFRVKDRSTQSSCTRFKNKSSYSGYKHLSLRGSTLDRLGSADRDINHLVLVCYLHNFTYKKCAMCHTTKWCQWDIKLIVVSSHVLLINNGSLQTNLTKCNKTG
jgi:hypothetical protein